MEHDTNQRQKFATLVLASSILIAGLLFGGAIIMRNGMQQRSLNVEAYPQQDVDRSQDVGAQAPSCGV